MFADLRGYTDFVERHGDDAGAELLRRYRDLVRGVVARFGGAEIRTEGDAFYVVFPSASAAVQGGLAILAAVRQENDRDAARPIRVAIGVHAGETAETGEGPVGSAVNIAARVCAQAQAGELLVTDTVRGLTRTRLPVHFAPRGSRRLKGIGEPIAVFAVHEPADATASGTGRAERARAGLSRPYLVAGAVLAVAAAGVIAAVAWGGLTGAHGVAPTASLPVGSSAPTGSSASVLQSPTQTATGSPSAADCSPISERNPIPVLTDVPFYRNDTKRDSVYKGPGPDCQPNVAWQQQLGQAATFVPVVVDGRVIVGDQLGLHAFDARSGAEAWTFPASGGFFQSAGANAGIVFAADINGTLHAVDDATGTERWHVPLPNAGISPLVADGLLWVGSSDGHALGLDPATGDQRWEWDGPAGVQADVFIVTADTAYIRSGGSLYSIRLVDRAELWQFDANGTGMTGPVLGADAIYVAGTGGGSDALYAVDPATGKNRWGPPFAIASGLQVTPGPFSSGVLYVGTDDDGMYALQDKGTTYEVKWHNTDVGAQFRPAALTARSPTLYVQQGERTLIALDPSDGSKVWDTPADKAGTLAPVVSGGLVFQVDDEAAVLRAWASPTLIAALGVASGSPSPSASPGVPDPFVVTATYPWFQTGIAIPAGMAIGPDGLLYVLHAKADYSEPQVAVIDPKTGLPARAWGRHGSGPGELDLTEMHGNQPGGCIAVAPNGSVFVGQNGNGRIEVFDGDGRSLRQIGDGEVSGVESCAIGPDGSFFAANGPAGPHPYEILRFDSKGRLVWHALANPDRPVATAFQVHDFTFLADGKLLAFIDSGGALTLDPSNGRVIGPWKEGATFGASGEPSIDGAGNVYLFTYVPSTLRVFSADGGLLGEQSGSGGLQTPGYQFSGNVFWPPPVFDQDGFGYSFGPAGLVRLQISLPK
jgi:outer membrane protein assembly factor BamB/class 3 adenylate cyclase